MISVSPIKLHQLLEQKIAKLGCFVWSLAILCVPMSAFDGGRAQGY